MQTSLQTRTTMGFTLVGWIGAALFVLAPATFFYRAYLIAETTAIEADPQLGAMTLVSLVLSLVSVPMMVVGRYLRVVG